MEGLNRISMEALYGQLDELGYLGERAAGRRTKNLRDGAARVVRMSHLKAPAMAGEDTKEPET